jgi:hypothetical protein
MELTFVGGILERAIVETYFNNSTKVPIEGKTFMPSGNVDILNSDSASRSGSSAGSKIPTEIEDKAIKSIKGRRGLHKLLWMVIKNR